MSDVELLARLIQCEAGGEGDNGMKAVATVVMNRVNIDYGEYAKLKSISDVIFQPYQFVCAMTYEKGQYNAQNLYNMNPRQEHYDIANWAIAGNKISNVAFALWFYNPYSKNCKDKFPTYEGSFVMKIGNHCFYNPTYEYANT